MPFISCTFLNNKIHYTKNRHIFLLSWWADRANFSKALHFVQIFHLDKTILERVNLDVDSLTGSLSFPPPRQLLARSWGISPPPHSLHSLGE